MTAHDPVFPPIQLGDGYFLSERNPTATADQVEIESRAIKMMRLPLIQWARDQARLGFTALAGGDVPAEAWVNFDQVIDEWTFHYVLLALNSDPNYPKVMGHFFGPPHEWFGMKVPGSRGPGTAENVDNNYTVIPVDGISRFLLQGRRFDPYIGDCPLQITTNLSDSINVSSLDWRDMVFEEDGESFTITIDPHPAEGRRNHLQTTIDSRYIFIRDGRMDWRQKPNAYRIHRLDPPNRPPLSDDETASLAARFVLDDVAPMFWFKQMVSAPEPNVMPPVVVSSSVGGMPSQKILCARLKIARDEAYVLNLGTGDAGYWFVGNYQWWLMSGDFWKTNSLNNLQSTANHDGTYTYVFALQDPRVHNWIDTLELEETLIMIRWHLLPQTHDGPGGQPWADGKLVKLSELDRNLPPNTTHVTPAHRAEQLANRRALFELRYAH